MLAILYALGMFVADLLKSRSRLEAENGEPMQTRKHDGIGEKELHHYPLVLLPEQDL